MMRHRIFDTRSWPNWFPSFLSLAVLLGLNGTVSAQSPLQFEQDTLVLSFQDIDLGTADVILTGRVDFVNSSTDTLELDWRRVNDPECQEGWEFIVGDQNITYAPGSSDSNVAALPVTMPPGSTSTLLVGVVHNQLEGCCDLMLVLRERTNSEVALDTVVFEFKINSDCATTSTEDLQEAEIAVYPNPVGERLTFTNSDLIREVRLIDSYGRVLSLNLGVGVREIDVSRLSPGIYFALIKSQNSVQTLPFVKQ